MGNLGKAPSKSLVRTSSVNLRLLDKNLLNLPYTLANVSRVLFYNVFAGIDDLELIASNDNTRIHRSLDESDSPTEPMASPPKKTKQAKNNVREIEVTSGYAVPAALYEIDDQGYVLETLSVIQPDEVQNLKLSLGANILAVSMGEKDAGEFLSYYSGDKFCDHLMLEKNSAQGEMGF